MTPALPFPRRVLTEQEAISYHLRYLADHLGPRPVGSQEGSRARRYLLDTFHRLGLSPELQAFQRKIPVTAQSRLLTKDGRSIPCLPVIGSPPTAEVVRGVPRLMSLDERSGPPSTLEPPGTVALVPVGFGDEDRAVTAAARQGVAAVLLYREEAPEVYAAVISNGVPVPCATIRRADACHLVQAAQEVELTIEVAPTDVVGGNIIVEIGTGGRALLFLTNYDTRPGTPGAYRNASGVAALLELLARLQGWRGHRILAGFLDGEEMGAAGSRHCRDVFQAAGRLSELWGVVYVSGLGLRRCSVIRANCPARSSLADLAVRCAAEEGVLSAARPAPSARESMPAGIWSCPVVVLTGPRLAVQHTALDRPDLLHPGFISRAVSVLDRLAQAV